MSTTFYDSRKNIMKRDASSGNTNMAAPSVSAYSGYLRVTNLVIPHNLGYPPQHRYYYEPFKDGVVYPQLIDRLGQYANNPLAPGGTGPGLIGWVDDTNLYLQLFYNDASLTGTFKVYWVIYRDYSLEV